MAPLPPPEPVKPLIPGAAPPSEVASAGSPPPPEAAPSAPTLAAPATVTEPGMATTDKRPNVDHVATVSFAATSSTAPAGAGAQLASVPDLHRQHRGLIRVVSHAAFPTEGADAASAALADYQAALAQADAVKKLLTDSGVPVGDIISEVSTKGDAPVGTVDVFLEY